MELEIGMYVRTINGKIWVIKSQQAISGHRKDIINASYDIIDLIEVGDYVNGSKIKSINGNLFNDDGSIDDINIKSIVTKEQFESMQYNLESKGE